jgi:aspartokinase
MKVLKFGGTSVGSAQRMKDVAKLICDGQQKIVVLSAMSGTTNALIEISDYLYKKNSSGAMELINSLEQKYMLVCDELYASDNGKTKGKADKMWLTLTVGTVCARMSLFLPNGVDNEKREQPGRL